MIGPVTVSAPAAPADATPGVPDAAAPPGFDAMLAAVAGMLGVAVPWAASVEEAGTSATIAGPAPATAGHAGTARAPVGVPSDAAAADAGALVRMLRPWARTSVPADAGLAADGEPGGDSGPSASGPAPGPAGTNAPAAGAGIDDPAAVPAFPVAPLPTPGPGASGQQGVAPTRPGPAGARPAAGSPATGEPSVPEVRASGTSTPPTTGPAGEAAAGADRRPPPEPPGAPGVGSPATPVARGPVAVGSTPVARGPVVGPATGAGDPAAPVHRPASGWARGHLVATETPPSRGPVDPGPVPRRLPEGTVPGAVVVPPGRLDAAGGASATPVPLADLPAAVVAAVRHLRHRPDGTQRLVVRLDPPELGSVQVDLLARGEEVHVVMRAEHDQAAGALREARPAVARALEAEGFALAGFDVSARDGDAARPGPHRSRPPAGRAVPADSVPEAPAWPDPALRL